MAEFPIDLSKYQPLPLDPRAGSLTAEQKAVLEANVALCREAIVFFTALGGVRGYGGHTGGPYDTVPEVLIADGFMRFGAENPDAPQVVPVFFDEAGHRVATQYLISVLRGDMPAERLLHYREFGEHLPGHPERGFTPGVQFSSGRLGHMWPMVNGVAMAHPDASVICLGSDGSQQEGNDAEAARLAVAQGLNVKLLIDDNDVTIAGHPSDYLQGYDVSQTLAGHGLAVDTGDGEDLEGLFARMAKAITTPGPIALMNKRKMAVGIEGLEGSIHGHDVISGKLAIPYLKAKGHAAAAAMLESADKADPRPVYAGSTDKSDKNRSLFGTAMVKILEKMSPEERLKTVKVFDCDLEGSTGLAAIRKAFPEVFVLGGIMERGNFSAAAGFGFDPGRQGVFSTFSAFLEMVVSEITMARLNFCNVLCHFSHAGVDDMADNTCHFGINNLFADGGIAELPEDGGDTTRVYFPGDPLQFGKCVERVFGDPGLRFVFSNRSSTPVLASLDGGEVFGDGYVFEPGKDDLLAEGSAGYVVSFGSTLHRAWGAVHALRDAGQDVGLVCKATLNVMDESMMKRLAASPAVLVAEEFNLKTGLGSRFGTELLKRGFAGKYNHVGVGKEGMGGLWRQMDHQGLNPEGIAGAFKTLVG
ncbi:MAG: transketolase [Planctomycetota bacterium]